MVAFERALADGADGVELDVRMSADGALVVAHDDHIATRGGPVALHRLSLAQIQALETTSCEPVPTLRQALEFQARTMAYLNVELKGDVPAPAWMARQAAHLIRQHGGQGILLSSFDVRQVRLLAQLLPHVPVALLFERSQKVMSKLVPTALLGAVAVHPQASLLDAAYMGRLRKKVAVINTWTVNSPGEAVRLSALGVDALITDDPQLILSALQ
jgi:glycerophosphoryl diester phosphodiesterase